MTTNDTKRGKALLLGLGALLVFAANLRGPVGLLAWVAPVPLLRFLRLRGGWRSQGLVLLTLVVGWCGASWKIVTDPLPAAFALLGLGFALFGWLPYLVWGQVRRRSEWLAPLAYGATVVVAEFLQPRLTPLSTWGAVVFTQVDDLPLLQLASLAGAGAVSFLVAWTGASLEAAFAPEAPRSSRRMLAAPLLAVVLAHAWGTARLAMPLPRETATVAAVGATLEFGPSTPLPGAAERRHALDVLLADSREAVRGGAALVVWNEASLLVPAEEEAEVVRRTAEAAREFGVQLVAAYIVPRATAPLLYENVLLWLGADGTVVTRYLKHRPAPGEPAVVGTGPLPVQDTPLGRMGAALCYDEDHPALGLEQGRARVDLVALPSSDWRGIDPIHTQMAGVRAVEHGMSILRSTRMGLSAGIDPLGRMRAWQSSFESGERVMRVALPRHRLPTVYAVVGDVLVWACGLFLVALAAGALRARVSEGRPSSPAN